MASFHQFGKDDAGVDLGNSRQRTRLNHQMAFRDRCCKSRIPQGQNSESKCRVPYHRGPRLETLTCKKS